MRVRLKKVVYKKQHPETCFCPHSPILNINIDETADLIHVGVDLGTIYDIEGCLRNFFVRRYFMNIASQCLMSTCTPPGRDVCPHRE